jgi:ubiquinol-cytochrome c reductase cytochrome c1 subunit
MTMIDGEMVEQSVGLRTDGDGKLTPEEYDQTILDLVNFLAYTGEPSRLQSEAIGKGVLIFILIFFVFVYLLKKDYWKDVKK